MQQLVDVADPNFVLAVVTIIFNPTFWNIVARQEYKNHFITKLCMGSAYAGCYLLAATIFFLGIYRDKVFADALLTQPKLEELAHPAVQGLSVALYAVGLTLVASSYWRLGITGTYLGDYFGILMQERVVGFPFNVTNNPMYNGSVMLFVAHALWNKSPAGLLISAVVFVVYKIALRFEEPFTEMIYKNQARKPNKKRA